MSNNSLFNFSYLQITELSDLEIELIKPLINTEDAVELLNSFFEYLAGIRNWDTIITYKLDNNYIFDAIALFMRSSKYDVAIKDDIKKRVIESWQNKVCIFTESKINLFEKLKKINCSDDALIEIKQEIYSKIYNLEVNSNFPNNSSDLNNSINLFQKLEALDCEVNDFNVLVDEYSTENKAHFIKVSEDAIKRFLSLVKNESLKHCSKEAELFFCLPELILSKQVDIIEKIADSKFALNDIDLSYVKNKPKSTDHQRLLRKVFLPINVKQDQIKDIHLSNIAQSVLNVAPSNRKVLNDFEDVERFRSVLNSIPNILDQANEWLGAAKFCQNLSIKFTAMGEGFLKYGLYQIEVSRYDHARKILIDSMQCLILGSYYNENSIEKAVVATLVSYISPIFISTHHTNERSVDWIDNPDPMFRLLKTGKHLSAVAKIWADELSFDIVAEKFIEVVSANIGDDRTLFKACAERLLTPYNCIKKTNRFINGLKWLIRDLEPSETLLNCLDKLSDEIESYNNKGMHIQRTNSLNSIIEAIILELESLPEETASPRNEIIEQLPKLIKGITGKDAASSASEPNLILRKLLNTIYPDERADIELPIMIRNDDNSGPACDVVLILRNDMEKKENMVEIKRNSITLGDILPGQQKEAIFLIDLAEGIANKVTELKFKFEIKIGDKVRPQGISIKIRPSNRMHKNSPYITGLAVTGTNFIGREKEIQRLLGALCGDKPNSAIAVFGIRRIGKTSILKQTFQHSEITSRYYTIFWDVEDRPLSDTSVDFLLELANKIRDSLPLKYTDKIVFSRQQFRDDPYSAFDRFIKSLNDIELPKRILIMIDEFDKLLIISDCAEKRQLNEDRIFSSNEIFQPEVFATLRKSLMNHSIFNLIIAGMPTIIEQKYEKRIFGLLEPLEIKAFNVKEAEKILLSGKNVIDFSTEAKEYVFEASGLQPYLLQVLCNEIFHRMKFSGRDIVAPFDVKEVIEEKILPNEKYFADYESLIGDAREVIYGLAKAHKRYKKGFNKFVSLSDIIQELARNGISYNSEDALNLINPLIEDNTVNGNYRPLIERASNNSLRFKLIIGILGEHIIRKGIN